MIVVLQQTCHFRLSLHLENGRSLQGECILAYNSPKCPIHNWPLRKASRLWRRRNSERIEVGEE